MPGAASAAAIAHDLVRLHPKRYENLATMPAGRKGKKAAVPEEEVETEEKELSCEEEEEEEEEGGSPEGELQASRTRVG